MTFNGTEAAMDLDRLPPMLTVGQVAKIFQVRPATVRGMLTDGRLPGVRLGTAHGDWRIPKAAVARLTAG